MSIGIVSISMAEISEITLPRVETDRDVNLSGTRNSRTRISIFISFLTLLLWPSSSWATDCSFTVSTPYCSDQEVKTPFDAWAGGGTVHSDQSWVVRLKGDTNGLDRMVRYRNPVTPEVENWEEYTGVGADGSTSLRVRGTVNWGVLAEDSYQLWGYDWGDQCEPIVDPSHPDIPDDVNVNSPTENRDDYNYFDAPLGPGRTLVVENCTPPPTCNISANPASISSGQFSTLTWNSSGANSATLTNVGAVGVNGALDVFPVNTQNYTLEVTGVGGTVSCSTTVNVSATPVTGSIEVIKNANPAGPTDFTFTTIGPGINDFSLDDDSDATLSNSVAFGGLADGAYSFTEQSVSGWSLNNVVCSGAVTSTITTNATGVAINLGGGESLVCTFNNQQTPCSITATAATTGCVNVGNDSNPNNDIYSVILTLSPANASTHFNYSSSPAGLAGSNISYGASPYTITPIVINSTDSPLVFSITDSSDNSCQVTTNQITEPGTCSTPGLIDLELHKTVKKAP